jgi:hypothetical protein
MKFPLHLRRRRNGCPPEFEGVAEEVDVRAFEKMHELVRQLQTFDSFSFMR